MTLTVTVGDREAIMAAWILMGSCYLALVRFVWRTPNHKGALDDCPSGCWLPAVEPWFWNSEEYRCELCGRRYRLTNALVRQWVEKGRPWRRGRRQGRVPLYVPTPVKVSISERVLF